MELDLNGRTALVTGASKGIGRETVRMLALEGVRVAAAARDIAQLRELANEVSLLGGAPVMPIGIDLAEPGSPEKLAALANAGLGTIDILVNAAGGSQPIAFDADHRIWEDAMALNFFRVRELTHALVPAMRARRFGRVISFTGMSEPTMINATFSAKAALHVWAKSISREVGPDGVTVNCIKPGTIHSAQMKRFFPTPESEADFSRKFVPVNRFGEPREIASLAVFLASPNAAYITGAVIPVDGGYSHFAF